MKRLLTFIPVALLLILSGCSEGPSYLAGGVMFPDYTDITIPFNIAPLNFRIGEAQQVCLTASGRGTYNFKSKGELLSFPMKTWKAMLQAEKGGQLDIQVTYLDAEGHTVSMQPFSWKISSEPIDRYMSYRLIEPAYEVWNTIQIEERDIETFSSRFLGDNGNAGNSCMNCHTSNRSGTSFMHLRGRNGGTLLNRNGHLLKLDTKTDSTMGGAVYGDISRDGRYGVFAAANITFAIHTHSSMRMEVFDTASDLLVIDFDNLTVTDSKAVKGKEFQETFPCFSADGKIIFFCRAPFCEQPGNTMRMHYDIAAVSFNPETGRVGDTIRTVISGASHNVSFSHPKCSPDGRFLLVTAAAYGTFPVWHQEAELWMIDLRNGHVNIMTGTNAWRADTYHSWSSNSRWITFASKRDDNVYGRPYMVFVNEDGKTGKAFLLPQKDPYVYYTTLKSFNLPELYTAKEEYNARTVARIYNSTQSVKVAYKSRD